jgi:hypothetical protein
MAPQKSRFTLVDCAATGAVPARTLVANTLARRAALMRVLFFMGSSFPENLLAGKNAWTSAKP